MVLQRLFTLLLVLSSHHLLVLFELGDSPMLLGECFLMHLDHFSLLLEELELILMKLFLMSIILILYLFGMTLNQLAVLLL